MGIEDPSESRAVNPMELTAMGAPWQGQWAEVSLYFPFRCPKKIKI